MIAIFTSGFLAIGAIASSAQAAPPVDKPGKGASSDRQGPAAPGRPDNPGNSGSDGSSGAPGA
ncbi:MAG: hypothetical protein ACO3YU_10180, partial [Candidatus Nanopelagicales bacterium]